MAPVLLLPPSEGKRPGGTRPWELGSGTFPQLATRRRTVAEALAAAMADPLLAAKLTGVQGRRHLEALHGNRSICGGPTLPAWKRYSGVVWEHLQPASLGAAARRRAARIVVVSAVGGLFAFGDPVPDYKLKMGANLPPLDVLSRFWQPAIGEALLRHAGKAPIVDLLPDEHRRALPPEVTRVYVEFRTASGRAGGHDAKAAKGRFARHLLEHGGRPQDAGASFRWKGWVGTVDDSRIITITAASRPPVS